MLILIDKKLTNMNINKKQISKIQEILNYDIKLFKQSFSDRDKERFFLEMGLLLTEGIHLKNALELLNNEDEKKEVRSVLNKLRDQVIGGVKFSEALDSVSVFSDYDCQNVSIAEESSKLPFVLNELGKYYAQKIKLKRLVISALSYPVLVLSIAFLAIVFLLNFIVPMFSEIFTRFNGDLPFITKLIISLSSFLKKYLIVIVLFFALFMAFVYRFKSAIWFKKLSSSFLLKIPVIGSLIQDIYLARFCNTLGLLLSAKVSIVKSLELCEKIVGFYPIDSTMSIIKQRVIKGDSLHLSMSEFSIFPKKTIALVKVGEEINKIDDMLLKSGKKYTENAEYQLEILNKVIEPILIVFLGFVVAIVLLAMYLPLFQLGSQIG